MQTTKPESVGWWAVLATPECDLIKFGRAGDVRLPYKSRKGAMKLAKHVADNNDGRVYLLNVLSNGQMVTFEVS